MTTPRDAAHEYLRSAWVVVPLYGVNDVGTCCCRAGRTCPSPGKHPSLGRAWHERALTSGADVHAWFDDHPTDNVGILTGMASRLFVVDVDGPVGLNSMADLATEHGAFPATRIVRTGSGGLHLYFRHPGHFTVHNSTSWLARGIDIRGLGGQVVAPPSLSGSGPYELISDHPCADPPAWLAEELREHGAHIERGHAVAVLPAERVDMSQLPLIIDDLRSEVVGVDQGRHKHFHAIMAACFDAQLTQGQAVTIVTGWCATVDKFVGRVEQEVARSWAKLAESAERQEAWLGTPARAAMPADRPTEPLAGAVGSADDTDDTDDGAERATWAAVDLDPILNGTHEPELPSLFARADGAHLMYAGRVHSFHGESESGKSLVLQWVCHQVIAGGGRVAYIDFESDAAAVVGRLLSMGASVADLRARFEYRHPDASPLSFVHERAEWLALAARPWDLIVMDGLTDAMGLFGASTLDNDEIAGFFRKGPRYLARKTNAAVALIDHVTKNAETRGRFALGGQAKMNALDGAAYMVDVLSPLGRGMSGTVALRIAKDRPGAVRPICGAPGGGTGNTQLAARITVDSTNPDELIRVAVGAPPTKPGDDVRDGAKSSRMEALSKALEDNAALSDKQLAGLVKMSRYLTVGPLMVTLETEGYVIDTGTARAHSWQSLRPYRAEDDPLSDSYIGPADPALRAAESSPEQPCSAALTLFNVRADDREEVTVRAPSADDAPCIVCGLRDELDSGGRCDVCRELPS